MDKVSGFVSFKRISMHISMTCTAQGNQISQTVSDLLITRTAHTLGFPVVNIASWKMAADACSAVTLKDTTPNPIPSSCHRESSITLLPHLVGTRLLRSESLVSFNKTTVTRHLTTRLSSRSAKQLLIGEGLFLGSPLSCEPIRLRLSLDLSLSSLFLAHSLLTFDLVKLKASINFRPKIT
jgi:hypothetical protein